MNVLILGGGGREHALAWKIKQSPLCKRLVVAPGNAGIAAIAETQPLAIEDPQAVVAFCRNQRIDFVVVGPEAPLAAGVVDALSAAGVASFGPRRAAAQVETSKLFTKKICAESGAPTAAWASFDRPDAAKIHVMTSGAPIVVKADGLAAGKGVTVAATVGQAMAAIDEIFAKRVGASAGQTPVVIIEEAMVGEEASLFVLTDGESVLSLGAAQDHKRAEEGDKGPNTGGMGAFSPSRLLTAELEAEAIETIVRPTLRVLSNRGTPYRGVLYAGLMLTQGPKGRLAPQLVEFNARFGDPETQVLLPRLDSDLLDALISCSEPIGVAQGNGRKPLREIALSWKSESAVTVVMAANGYPGGYPRGETIGGLAAADAIPGATVFHAGTALSGDRVVSAGGRVLNATGLGATLEAARGTAYAALREVDWSGGFYRRDIGARAADEETAALEASAKAEEAARREAAYAANVAAAAAETRARVEREEARLADERRTEAPAAEKTSDQPVAPPPAPPPPSDRRAVTDAVVLDPWSDDGAGSTDRRTPRPDEG